MGQTRWAFSAPDNSDLPLMIAGGELYIPATSDVFGRKLSCFVKMSDGKVSYTRPQSHSAYALSWEIAITDDRGDLHRVLKL